MGTPMVHFIGVLKEICPACYQHDRRLPARSDGHARYVFYASTTGIPSSQIGFDFSGALAGDAEFWR